MKVISAEFFEVVPVPHASQDVVHRIYPDSQGSRFDMIFDPRGGMIVIVNKADRAQIRCVPTANVKHFQLAPEHSARFVSMLEKQEQDQSAKK